MPGKAHKPKVFRIHLDVHFSRNKTPYNTQLHLVWSRPGLGPTWFFGASPDYLVLGMGIIGLEKDSLTTFRQMIDTHDEALYEATEASGAQISDWGPDPLKRVPKPYSQDHPQAALLKRKALAVAMDLPTGWEGDGLLKTLNTMIPSLLPTWKILDETFPG